MPSRNELKKISNTRLKEVKVLYKNSLYDGGIHLSGYVAETALKARICRILDSDYPESGEISRVFLTHKFDNLIKLGGLQRVFDKEMASNVDFKTNWSIVTGWKESHRYRTIGSGSKIEIEKIITALEDKSNGVLTWIKKRW